MEDLTESPYAGIAFIGNSLGPLFYFDPQDARAADIIDALAALDPADAREWPFSMSDPQRFEDALRLIDEGLHNGIDEDLVWEYRRLFVGPATKAAPPWGSVYTDKDQVIFGLSTLDLRRWMREHGIEKRAPEGEPDDHIGLLLLMMSWLAQNDHELLPGFLELHLLPWAPHFLSILRRETTHPFFEGLAMLTAASLEGIRNDLGLDVEEPRFYR